MKEHLRQLPFLRQLTPVELAKLLPDITEIHLGKGERLESLQAVCLVAQGRLELRRAADDSEVRLWQLAAGDFFGETVLASQRCAGETAVALEPTHLFAVSPPAFRELLRTRPLVAAEFNQLLVQKSAERLQELGRVRRMLGVYSQHLWDPVELGETLDELQTTVEAAAAATQAESSAARGTGRERRSRRLWNGGPRWKPSVRVGGFALATLTAGGIAFAPYEATLGAHERYILAFLVWGAVCWLFQALPDFVVALATCVGVAAVNLAPPTEVLSGFSKPTWFMLMGIWCLGAAVSRTGLVYRVALHVLHKLPNTYFGQSLALAITGTLLSPLLPSSQGRIMMAAPLTMELADALRLSQGSKGTTGLAMASFLGFGQMYFLFLNGTTTSLLAWSLLPANIKALVTWYHWLQAAAPLGLIVFVLTLFAVMRLFPPGSTSTISRDVIASQLRILGPMRPGEWWSLCVMVSTLMAFVTGPLHHVDPTWFAVGGALVLVTAGVLDKEALLRDVDWSFLLFFGAVISIADLARLVRLDLLLADFLQPLWAPVMNSPVAAISLVALTTLVLRLAMSPIQVIPLLTIALTPLFIQAGYNPFSAVLTIVAASTTFVAPLLSPNYTTMLAGTQGRMFTNESVFPLALIHTGILLLGIVASVPYWRYLAAL